MAAKTLTGLPKGKVEFIDYHRPFLESGKYKMTLTQTLAAAKDTLTAKHTSNFYVKGPRFHLPPEEFHAVFPPLGSNGDHTNAFPHIILNHDEMPWERTALKVSKTDENQNPPWLALLLFTKDEMNKYEKKSITIKELTDSKGFILDEISDDKTAQVNIIDVDQTFLESIMPTEKDLNWMSHVRVSLDENGKENAPHRAVVFGNRLPTGGEDNEVHLVSLEGTYTNGTFDYDSFKTNGKIRLVSLHSWSFFCKDHKFSFTGLLENTNHNPIQLKMEMPSKINGNKQSKLKPQLDAGFVPKAHITREGNKTVSWYRGPLIPAYSNPQFESIQKKLPVANADELLRYMQSSSMLDTSYSAAWELGRLMALQNQKFAKMLYDWKRKKAQLFRKQTLLALDKHDALPNTSHPPVDLPPYVLEWLDSLRLLNGIPFNYIVPSEKLLPTESLRFFSIDPAWIATAIDGALSIGRGSSSDFKIDEVWLQNNKLDFGNTHTGFLLRSQVVKAYPQMQIDAYSQLPVAGKEEEQVEIPNKLELLRKVNLAPGLLLCIFEGQIKTIDFHLKPEVIHFGLNDPAAIQGLYLKKHPKAKVDTYIKKYEGNIGWYGKKIRDENGIEQEDYRLCVFPDEMPYQVPPSVSSRLGVIKMNDFAIEIKHQLERFHNKPLDSSKFGAAAFGLAMIEGAEMVRFTGS